MTALYDDDPVRDAEAAADTVLREVREYLIAVATAPLIGEPDAADAIAEALNTYVAHLLGTDDGPSILAKALYDAVWCGGRGVEREARRRLLLLRDVPHNGIVTAVLEQGVQP